VTAPYLAVTRPMPNPGRLLAGQIGYQARLLASGRAITIGVGLPVILLIGSHGRGTQATAADAASYAVFGLTLTAWATYGVRLVAAREAGVLKRWRATPLPRWCYFLGRVIATIVVSVAAAAATIAVSVLLYHTHLTLTGALGALAVFVLGAFAWAAMATAVTAVIPTIEAASPTLMLIYFPVIIISGTFGSVSEPHWLATFASYLPAQPLADAAGSALSHVAGQPLFSGRDLLVLAAWTVAGLGVAIATFRWEPSRPRHGRKQRHRRCSARRARLLQDQHDREDQQRGAEHDQGVPHAGQLERTADAHQEQHRC
jgi:ABC-2 type transport system permease protein